MAAMRSERRRPSPDLARWAALTAEDNSQDLLALRQKLARALREEVTPRQRQVLGLYYHAGLNETQIGARLGVCRSTVSRTLRRGEDRLRRCLRYSSPALLEAARGPRTRRGG